MVCGLSTGYCTYAGSGTIGAACTSDPLCASGQNIAMPWCIVDPSIPGGMCSDLCTTTVACATGGTCVGASATSNGVCYKSCTTLGLKTECGRTDMVCDDFTFGTGAMKACVPACTTVNVSSVCGTATNVRCAADGRCCGTPGNVCCTSGTACVTSTGGASTCNGTGYCP